MENAITVATFIKPHKIEELGEEGLTAFEISSSLGINIRDIHKKIKRQKWHSGTQKEWRCVPYGTDGKSFAFNLNAAKAFVARWSNALGDGYLQFLFDCEKVATELTPRLVAKVAELEAKLEAAELNHIKRDRKLLRAVKKGMILAPIYSREMLFETKFELKWEMRQKETLDELTRLRAEITHLNNITIGTSTSAAEKTKRLFEAEAEEKNRPVKLMN